MSDPDPDFGSPISYKVLARGTPCHAANGDLVGTVREVLQVPEKDVFDGLLIDTPKGRRFVDGPEVGRIYERRVELALDPAAVDALPTHDSAGGATYAADPAVGKVGAMLKRGWRRR